MRNQITKRRIAQALSALMLLSMIQTSLFAAIDDRIEYKVNRILTEVDEIRNKLIPTNRCEETFDYIIVGDGTAGAILARRLSDPIGDVNPKVLVLERGANNITFPDGTLNPLLQSVAIASPNTLERAITSFEQPYAKLYDNVLNVTDAAGTTVINKRLNTYSMGNGWGGGGSHFFTNTFRGTVNDWADYAAACGDSSWNYSALLPIFKDIETYTVNTGGFFDPAERGSSGLLSIIQTIPPATVFTDPILSAFASAAVVGLGTTLDQNDSTQPQVGVGVPQRFMTLPINAISGGGAARSWSHTAFLPIGTVVDANGFGLGGRQLEIRSNVMCDRVVFDGTKAIGVDYVTDDGVVHRVCANEIILCASTHENPAILQRSGIGASALLESFDIPVIVNNPNVGAHMRYHVGAGATFTGNFSNPQGQAILLFDLHGIAAPFNYPADGQRRAYSIPNNSGTTIVAGPTVTSNSEGSVQITARDPYEQLLIQFNQFADDQVGTVNGSDLNRIMTALKICRQLAIAAGIPITVPSAAQFASDTALATYVKGASAFQSHNCGTCRLGTSSADGVVDANLKVFGVTNLTIADLSVLPHPTMGNTANSAMVVAAKAASTFGLPVPPVA